MRLQGISDEDISKFLKYKYGFIADKIEYLPFGEDGAYYIVHGNDKKYFLKIYVKGEIFSKSEKEFRVINNFLYNLRNKFHFTHTHSPIKNMEKDTVSVFKGMPFILYEFVGGVNPKKLTRGMYEELGNIISELHNLNISYFKGIKEDKFNFSLENNIYNILKSLEENNFKKRTSSYKLKKLFLENNDFILGIIPFLKKESNYIKKRRKAYVITHGDIHKGNILTGKNGTCIIDWEHLELALPENDIMWFRDNKHFYYSYVNGLKKSYKPDKRAMKFYIIRKGLNEFVFFSTSILYGKNGEKISNKKIKFMKRQFKILKNIFYSQRFK